MNPMPASSRFKRSRAALGFTLIEVMIVVAIIGILAAIAYPSYREYIIRGRIVDATNALAETRALMERHFQDNRNYQSVPGFASPCTVARNVGDFVVVCEAAPTAPPNNTYTIVARANAGSVVANFVFTIDQQGAQATTGAPAGWTNCALPATRWLTKKGTPCV